MFKKILISTLIVLSTSTVVSANSNGMIKIINNIKVDEGLIGIAEIEINHEKRGVRPNNQYITVEIPGNTTYEFNLKGVIIGNTYQPRVDSSCHIKSQMQPGTF